jgi:hypothetical protein
MWSCFVNWRYRGISPAVTAFGPAAPAPDGMREEAVLHAFALEAGRMDGASREIAEALPMLLSMGGMGA